MECDVLMGEDEREVNKDDVGMKLKAMTVLAIFTLPPTNEFLLINK